MHEYSTDWRVAASPPLTPRLKVLRALAADALAEDTLTMTPLGALGSLPESTHEQILDQYLFASAHFEILSESMTIANGWQALLGGSKAALVNSLRALQGRNWKTGSYEPWIKVSAREMASFAGVSERTIQRWLKPGPSLDVVLDDYMKQQADKEAGRRRKVSMEPLRCALLRLFIREKQHTGYHNADGAWRQGKNAWKILPIDPLVGTQEEALFAWLDQFAVNGELGSGVKGKPEMRLCAAEETILPHCPSETTDDTPLAQNRLSGVRPVTTPVAAESSQLRQNSTGLLENAGLPATTKWQASQKTGEKIDRYSSGSAEPQPALGVFSQRQRTQRLHSAGKVARVMRTHAHTRACSISSPETRNGEVASLLKTESIPEKRGVVTKTNNKTTHAHARTRTRTREEQSAWYEEHAEEIQRYRAAVGTYLMDFHLGDRAPASTATRVARLLAGAKTPFEEIADILYAAYQQARTGRGSHLVAHEGAVFRRTPRFLRSLQALLGGAANPAYCPPTSGVPQWGHSGSGRARSGK